MSVAQLHHFVVVAEEQHVGRASARLHISQPPLSRSIQNLEDELGVRLFERTPRGMRLLPEGALFLEHARRVLDAMAAAVQAVRAARGPSSASRDCPAGPGVSSTERRS